MNVRAILAAGALLIFLGPSLRAQNLVEETISIQDDGSAVIAEHLQLPGPMTQPVRWRLATQAETPEGVRRKLFVDVLEVSDEDSAPLKFWQSDRPEYVQVIVPAQPVARATIKITYNVRNAVRFRSEHDELFWRVGGTWNVPVSSVVVHATVPEAVIGQFNARLYSGDDSTPATIAGRFANWTAAVTPPAFPAVDVVLPSGILQPPSPFVRVGWFLRANPIVLFPLLVLLAMLGLRQWAARQEQIAVAPRYEPPADLTPIETGYLVDNRVDPRDVAATLLDLARRGFIRLEECKPDEGVPYAGQDFRLRLLKPMGQWAGAKSYEDIMLFHTFYGGQWTKLSSLSLRFYSVVPMMERQVRYELQEKGLYSDPRRAQALRILAVVIVSLLFGLGQGAGWFAVTQYTLLGFACIAAAVLMVWWFTRDLPFRTGEGARVYAELRGFEDFLNCVEADRMERLTPELFERFLPYAVALGVEHHWGDAFSTISSGPPLWFAEQEQGAVPDFMRRIGMFSLATNHALVKVPRGASAAAALPRMPAPPPVEGAHKV
ncbi:MAG TPA: DUF2207 domain-containing protein [Terriglobales bacterium]|nr:DUF2207 domain-containing protein [Terriglobales bacterium]